MNIRDAISNELHKQVRKHFITRSVELKGLHDLYQADLVEMIPYTKINKGYKYILTMINCFSKYAFAVPMKTKSSSEVVKVLKPILQNNKMNHLQTDRGKEWYNVSVQNLLKQYNINHYSTYSDKKASIIERFNRTLKNKMWKWFTANGKYSWVKILPDLLEKYNHTIHRTINMKPVDVNAYNEKEILSRINKKRIITKTKALKFKIGDRVRISKYKKIFTKGYLPNWTNELFTIYSIKPTVPKTYVLKDDKGNILKGGFYEQEISKTKYADIYLIEKILKRKGDKVLVRWLGYDKSHDSWVNKNNII